MGDAGSSSRKFITRKEAADYITRLYFKVTARTMAVWASEKWGPPYRLLGGQAHYTSKDIDEWVEGPANDGAVPPTRPKPGGVLGVLDRK